MDRVTGRRAPSDRLDRTVAGGLTGLLAGIVTGALLADQDAMAGAAFGASGAHSGFALYVVVSACLGAAFGFLVNYERGTTAASRN
jgi:hypothetical protein